MPNPPHSTSMGNGDPTAHTARLHLVDEHGYSTAEADGYSEAGVDYVHWLDHEALIDPHQPHP